MADPTIVIDNIQVVSATSVTADVTPGKTSRKGFRTVNVVNPDGGASSLANGYSIMAPPGAPTAVRTQAGDTAVLIAWTAPADPGSSAVSGYRVTFTDGTTSKTVTTSTTAAYVPGLTNGTTYTFTVAAKNATVDASMAPVYGAESAAVTATPRFRTVLTSKISAVGQPSGAKLTASGTLTRYSGGAAIAGATIAVHYVPSVGGTYTHQVKTGADGTWSDPASPAYNTTFTASYAGTSSVAAAAAPSVTIDVATKITLTSPKSGASSAATTVLSVTGVVSPNKAGAAIQLFNGSKAISRVAVAKNGTYLFRVTLAKGTYSLHVAIGRTSTNRGGSSPTVTVKRT